MNIPVPIQNHPELPQEVPLVGSFHDDRNRLSYYYPRLQQISGVTVPQTRFLRAEFENETVPKVDFRDISSFMIKQQLQNAFIRGDFSSGKYRGTDGSKITSQDSENIEDVFFELTKQLMKGNRRLGSVVAVREWIPHEYEVRYILQDGEIVSKGSENDLDESKFPDTLAQKVADEFTNFSWSCDFIRHKHTDTWYCIDMGLHGLYYDGVIGESYQPNNWTAISEHPQKDESLHNYRERMPTARRLYRTR